MTEKIVLGYKHYIVEPLALFYLSTIAESEGFEPRIVLGTEPDYNEFSEAIKKLKPSFLGMTVYTGSHIKIRDFSVRARRENPGLNVIVGGPHPTFFPGECLEFADYVVVGEGFDSFRRILKREVNPGIVLPEKREPFPVSAREDFYRNNPEHGKNRIKSVISGTGCKYSCSHCYNSSDFMECPEFDESQKEKLKQLYPSRRFFSLWQRPVKDVVDEVKEIQRLYPAEFLYFQDDIFGMNLEWLREFAQQYDSLVPFHTNMRFEHVDPQAKDGKERLDLLKKAGCTGFSIAIESAEPVVCREVLGRHADNEMIFRSMEALSKYGFKVRTNQMLGLPYGATSKPTKINLEADLASLELNVKLKRETGLPTFAWASTLMPYPGTRIADYCQKHGFYQGDFTDITGEETYRIQSVLRHIKEWKGPKLSPEDNVWLSEQEQETYRKQVMELMNFFPVFAELEDGDKLARRFLTGEDLSSHRLNKVFRSHRYDTLLFASENL